MMKDKINEIKRDEVDLQLFFNKLFLNKYKIFAISSIFSLIIFIYSLFLPNIYISKAILSPSSDSQFQNQVPGNFSGLAAVAGIDLQNNGTNKTAQALEILQSRKFFVDVFNKHDLFPELMATKYWDQDLDQLVFDESKYDVKEKKWINSKEPKISESLEEFEKQFNVSVNSENGFITISVEHISPSVAKKWLEILITELNETVRVNDTTEAEKSIEYLLDQARRTSTLYLKEIFYDLVQVQTEKIMISKASEEYALKTLDPPYLPDEKSKPMRALIFILSFVASLLLIVSYYFFRNMFDNK